MNIKQIEAEIQALVEEQTPFIDQMDQLFLEFQAGMPGFVKKWATEEFAEKVSINHVAIMTLDQGQREELKNEFSFFLDSILKNVSELFGDKETWPQHKPFTSHWPEYDYNLPIIQNFVRQAITPMGTLFRKYDLRRETNPDSPTWSYSGDKDPIIDFRVIFPFPPSGLQTKFTGLFFPFSSLALKIARKEEELNQAKALELLDLA